MCGGAGRVSGGDSDPQGQTHEAVKRGQEERKDIEQGQIQWKEMDSIFVSPLSSCQPCSPCPMGGCHGDRRPHVLGASFLVKGAHCSCVKPSSVCPSARDGGFSFTPLTKTQSTPCCVEVRDAQRPSDVLKLNSGGGGVCGEAAVTQARIYGGKHTRAE